MFFGDFVECKVEFAYRRMFLTYLESNPSPMVSVSEDSQRVRVATTVAALLETNGFVNSFGRLAFAGDALSGESRDRRCDGVEIFQDPLGYSDARLSGKQVGLPSMDGISSLVKSIQSRL